MGNYHHVLKKLLRWWWFDCFFIFKPVCLGRFPWSFNDIFTDDDGASLNTPLSGVMQ